MEKSRVSHKPDNSDNEVADGFHFGFHCYNIGVKSKAFLRLVFETAAVA
jgi:hypothetical protein